MTNLQISPNSGYIVWKNRKIAILFSNDLDGTPSEDILSSETEEALCCVHRTELINRWSNVSVYHQECIQSPDIVADYNIFMNGVDKLDQMSSMNPTHRREKRLQMTLFA